MMRRAGVILVLGGLAVSIAACGSTSTTPAPTASTAAPSASAEATSEPTPSVNASDAYPFLAGYEGHFAGTWKNTTFGSTGSMAWDITPDPSARTIKIVVNVGGNFFGGAGAPPETLLLTHLADGVIAGKSPTFGDISGTITPDGKLDIALGNISGGSVLTVEISGTFSGGDTIAMEYAVKLAAGGEAKGTVSLKRA